MSEREKNPCSKEGEGEREREWSMEKATVAASSKRGGSKESKSINKKKQPLKVVYITNPMKFTATASEFRALVQELTGKYADVPDSSTFAAAEEGGKEGLVHAAAPHEVVGLQSEEGEGEGGGGGAEKGTSDLSTSTGSYEDEAGFFCSPGTIDDFEGLEASRLMWHDEDEDEDDLDVFKRLGDLCE